MAVIDEKSANLNLSERARLRRLIPRFNSHAKRKLFGAILPHCETHPKNALALLKALSAETVDFIAEQASVEQLFSLVGGVSVISDGRTWLEGETLALQRGIFRTKLGSETVIREWFNRMRNLKPRVRAIWIEMMANRLGLE